MEKRIALITSRYWEGAYVCNLLIKNSFDPDIFVQKTWWRDENNFLYTEQYLRKVKQYPDRYFVIESLTDKVQYIEDINSDSAINKLSNGHYDAMVIVGSRILKKHTVKSFKDKIINYHTGLLPEYRGPYSEFWAIYNNEPHMIGTTIHLVDERIDSGSILKRKPISTLYYNPVVAHIDNALQGAELLVEALHDYLYKNLKPNKQDESKAIYYSFPTEEQISLLEQKIGEKIDLYFAD